MPGMDRSGPMGAGPMTGGRQGPCGGGYGWAGVVHPGYGQGLGWRRGYGRGRSFGQGWVGYRRPWAPGPAYPFSKADEMAMLRAEAQAMQASLAAIQQRIAEMEKEGPE